MKNSRKIAFATAFAAAIGATTYFGLSNKDTNTPKPKTQETSKFLFLSDVHLNTASDTTYYGVDTGLTLWKVFLAKADSVIVQEKPNFIVYTGDLPAHYGYPFFLPKGLRTEHNKNLTTILAGLRSLANQNNTPLFYLPGNNDAIAGDYFSFADEDDNTPLSLVPENSNPYPALKIGLWKRPNDLVE